ncbi:MAG: hypothetical protein ABI813_01830 [Bacteroidota bacterium]
MKLYLLPLLLLLVYTAHTQTRDANKTDQVEQLQQLRQTVTRRIDTLHRQLVEQGDSISAIRKKLDQLKKDNQAKTDMNSGSSSAKTSQELLIMTTLANTLQKKFDTRVFALNKAINLQKDLEDKIFALLRESNR